MLRVAVLASGRGSNFAALLDASRTPDARYELVGLYSDRAEAPALELARTNGLDSACIERDPFPSRAAFDQAFFTRVLQIQPHLIVCAGYMRVISAQALAQLNVPLINIHPSLLPRYPGLDTHARALAAGDREHGASVHLVTPELDGGPVLAQARVAIEADDTPDALAARVLVQEHRLLPACVALFARNRLQIVAGEPWLDGARLKAPLQLHADGLP